MPECEEEDSIIFTGLIYRPAGSDTAPEVSLQSRSCCEERNLLTFLKRAYSLRRTAILGLTLIYMERKRSLSSISLDI